LEDGFFVFSPFSAWSLTKFRLTLYNKPNKMRSILHWAFSLTLLFCAQAVLGQDIILLKSKEEIKAKVLEINESEMKYKRFENLSGPTYSIRISKVAMVRYENGFEEVFNETVDDQLMDDPNKGGTDHLDPLLLKNRLELVAGIGQPLGDFALSSGDDAGFARTGAFANLTAAFPVRQRFGVSVVASFYSNGLNGDFQNSFFQGQVLDNKNSSYNGAYTSLSLMPGVYYQVPINNVSLEFSANAGINMARAPEYYYSYAFENSFFTTRYEFRPETSFGFSSMLGATAAFPLGKGSLCLNLNTLIRNNTFSYRVKSIIGVEGNTENLEFNESNGVTAIILGLGAGYRIEF
jgi:hypothetical protein